ncbi:glycosyltransferase [Janibacter hoylei]|uniref:glycosyltransferase n=1 Tax=Janibacter hoylei TaxID=364298 RepID=UPI002238DA72|nr:glycosyltransferase [Janibacter hoylei]MCW4602533.1 glycosyltransferase [Janibacter hoylei]
MPALMRIFSIAWSTPADVVHVTGVHLIPVALAHNARHRSTIVLDINERPASVKARGSLFGALSWIEPLLIKAAAPRAGVVTVVTPGHAKQLSEELGVEGALVVRNAPLASWRSGWVEPPSSPPLRVVTVGGLFLGRALEMLIRAVGQVHRETHNITLTIVGTGRPEYLASLRALIDSEALGEVVELREGIESHEVSAMYTRGHVGLALYEGADPGNDSLSNKIIETVSSGRPVLAGDLPENRAFVMEYRVGWLTKVTEEGIAESLRGILRLSRDELRAMGQRCFEIGGETLTWEREFRKVIDGVEDLRP